MESRRSSWFEKIALMVKLGVISGLMLLLLIPQFMVMGLITERQSTRDQAVREVSEKWGGRQNLSGPILTVPYQVFTKSTDDKGIVTVHRSVKTLRFLPEELSLKAQTDPETRRRGIFEVVLYRLQLDTQGSFKVPPASAFGIEEKDMLWSQASLATGISDLRGIRENVLLDWNGRKLLFQPGTNGVAALPSGIYAQVPLSSSARSIAFSYRLNLNGSQKLDFAPLGKTTTVQMASAWNSPSFQGNFLPHQRQIDAKGFTAEWQVFHLARNIPQSWRNDQVSWNDLSAASFGVDLVSPVDAYQKATRAAKYGVLYILLTFGVFFLFEILAGLRIHYVQYVLVAFAIILFYLLLVSLSEHIAFNGAYALACLGVVGMITGYSRSVLCDWKRAGTIGSLMCALYGNLYVLLQAEDYALLLGALGLFIVLSAAMYVTRKVDWFQVGRSERH